MSNSKNASPQDWYSVMNVILARLRLWRNIFSTKDNSFQLVPVMIHHYCFIILLLCCIIWH